MMDNNIISKLTKFNEKKYSQIDLDRLVVFSMVFIDRLDVPLNLENIIVASFFLFPLKFSLQGYPHFPDATRVEKALWRCKGKNRLWIGGKTPHGFSLNRRSYLIAEEVKNELSISSEFQISKKKNSNIRRRSERILKGIEKSNAYNKFQNGHLDDISEAEFCSLLQTTLDSPKTLLKENLSLLFQIADDLDKKNIIQFLKEISANFSNFLNSYEED